MGNALASFGFPSAESGNGQVNDATPLFGKNFASNITGAARDFAHLATDKLRHVDVLVSQGPSMVEAARPHAFWDMMNPFFTIGHSTRRLDIFVDLLKDVGVRLVVDVRTIPRSRSNSQYTAICSPGHCRHSRSDTSTSRPLAACAEGNRLDRDKLHGGTQHRLGNRFRIAEVVLLSPLIWPDMAGRHQLCIAAESLELPTQVMRPNHASMPLRQGGMLASRALMWLRNSRLMRWYVFLPMSMLALTQ